VVRQAQEECAMDAAETAEAVRNVLRALGYVDGKGLTPRAWGLREIVAASGIVLSELYVDGFFDRLDPMEMAEVISWFAVDRNRRKENSYRLPKRLHHLRRRAVDAFRSIAALEASEGVELAQGPSEWLFGVALAWCEGDSIEDITQSIDLGEGDVVSTLNKTVDLLDQFESMLIRFDDQRLLRVTHEARRLLVRGLVAMVRSGDALVDPAVIRDGAAVRLVAPGR
jgi:superfamily II RNA helicase